MIAEAIETVLIACERPPNTSNFMQAVHEASRARATPAIEYVKPVPYVKPKHDGATMVRGIRATLRLNLPPAENDDDLAARALLFEDEQP